MTDTADRVAAERPVLRAAEDDMVGNIVELQAARDRAERWTVETDGVVACPFKGLASFDVDDAGVFFGRERLVAEMVARLTGAPLMGIVGPSGSGKSSALRAGCSPRSPPACCRAASAGRSRCCAPVNTRCARSSRRRPRCRRAAGS